MDPNATLARIRELVRITLDHETDSNDEDRDNQVELADLIHSLDVWLVGGGFLPTRWERKA